MPLPFALIVEKEKRLILLDRAAQRTAELVQIELFFGNRKKAASVELRVAKKFKQRPVEGV